MMNVFQFILIKDELDLQRNWQRYRAIALFLFGLSFIGWWGGNFFWPSMPLTWFFGETLVPDGWQNFLIADAMVCVATFWIAWDQWRGVVTNSVIRCAWLGGILYPAAFMFMVAVREPVALPGFLLMVLSAAFALAIEISISGLNIVWGPFRFIKAEPAPTQVLLVRLTKQITAMWSLSMIVIPAGILVFQAVVGWDNIEAFRNERWMIAGLVFVLCGVVGVTSGRQMVRSGDGTPLPAVCTHKLVTTGVYGVIRNPMALTGVTQIAMIGVMLGSLPVVTFALCGGLLWNFAVRPLEESYLLQEFDDEFLGYINRVPCWWIKLPSKKERTR